jgi:hypothetical protein
MLIKRRSERHIEDRYSLSDSNIKKRINRNRNGNRNRIKKRWKRIVCS